MNKIIFTIIFSLSSVFCFANEIKTESYEKAISKKDTKVLVVMGADWCKYCVKLKSNLSNMDLSDYLVVTVDVDKRKDLKDEYKVKTLPTSFIIFNGKIVSEKIGYDKKSYLDWIKEHEDLYGSLMCCQICCKCKECKINFCRCCKCD